MPPACCSREPREAGYATAAAALVSLALAVVAAAVSAMALTGVRTARSEFERIRVAALLDGGQLLAALRITDNGSPGRLRWQESTPDGVFMILAEPEAAKLDAAKAFSNLDLLRRLGSSDPAATARKLADQAKSTRPEPIATLEAANLWRACAGSLLSYNGRAERPVLTAAAQPAQGVMGPRGGAVWRVRVSTAGYVDERLVRMTGDAARPALVMDRRFGRGREEGERCGALIGKG